MIFAIDFKLGRIARTKYYRNTKHKISQNLYFNLVSTKIRSKIYQAKNCKGSYIIRASIYNIPLQFQAFSQHKESSSSRALQEFIPTK